MSIFGRRPTPNSPVPTDDVADAKLRLAAALRFKGAQKRVDLCRRAAHALLSAREREPRFDVLHDWIGELAPLKVAERDIVRKQVAKLLRS